MMSRIRWIAICGNIVASIAIGVLIGVIGAFTTPVHAADMNKVIRTVFPVGEEGFDPAASHDLYSGTVEEMIFETLFTYDYLGRPAKVVPLTAEALPQVTDERPDLYDPVAQGNLFHTGSGVQGSASASSSPPTMSTR